MSMAIPLGPEQKNFFQICNTADSRAVLNLSLQDRAALEKRVDTAYEAAKEEIDQVMHTKAKHLSAIDKKVINIIADGSKKLADIEELYKQISGILHPPGADHSVSRPFVTMGIPISHTSNIKISEDCDSSLAMPNLELDNIRKKLKSELDTLMDAVEKFTEAPDSPEIYAVLSDLLNPCNKLSDEIRDIRTMQPHIIDEEIRDKYTDLLLARDVLERSIDRLNKKA